MASKEAVEFLELQRYPGAWPRQCSYPTSKPHGSCTRFLLSLEPAWSSKDYRDICSLQRVALNVNIPLVKEDVDLSKVTALQYQQNHMLNASLHEDTRGIHW